MARNLLLCALLSISLSAQRTTDQTTQPKQLNIKVLFDAGPSAGMGNRVQLLTGTGSPVNEGFTDDRGEVTFMVEAGNYQLRVTGPNIEEAASERSFYIDPRDFVRSEYITVKKKVDPNVPSLEPHVSAAMLRIPDKARNEFSKGMKDLKDKEFDSARSRFEKAVKMYPQYAEAINALGIVAMNTGSASEGRALFDKAIAADPEYAGAYVNKAKILMAEKQIAPSRDLLSKSVSLDPMNTEALSLLAMCQLQTGDGNGAINSAERIHKLPHEKWAIVHYIAGLAFEQQRQPEDALREFKLFLKEAPPDSKTIPTVKKAVAALENAKP